MLKLFHTNNLYKTNFKNVLYTTINLSKYLNISMKKLLLLFLLCSVIINAQAQGASIISTNRPTYKIGDTIQLRGKGIKTLQLKSFASRDSFVVNTFISKLLSNTDTLYNFIVPNTVKNDVYLINAFSYTSQLSDSIRLVRFFVIPSNIDSLGVIGWGRNDDGQTNIPAGLKNVIQVAGGRFHSLALKADGTVVAWGNNDYGQAPISAGLNYVVQVAAGAYHSLALKADGNVVAWGLDGNGQTSIPAGLNNVVQVAGGLYHSIALNADGTVVAWGNNDNGQATIPAGLNNVVQVAAGAYHSLALKADGTLVTWGNNDYGQAPISTGLNNVVQIAGGDFHSLALKADGNVVAWGLNGNGQTSITAGLNNVVKITSGDSYSLALKADGNVVAWGSDGNGQTSIPAGLNNVVQIAGGYYHSLAIAKLYVNTTTNIGDTITPTTFVKNGDSLRITFQPNIGYFIDSIFINGVLNIDSLTGYTFKNITQFQNVRVVYKLQTFTITSSAGNGGSISPQDTTIINYGTKVLYTITSNIGYIVDTLFVNGNRVDSTTSYTFDSVKSNQTIVVKFKPITAPGKPLNVFAVEGDSKAIIHFVSPIYNGGVPINKYIVEEIGGNYKDSGATSPITITGLTNLQTYQFSVKAVNSYGLVSDTSLSNLIQPVEMKLVKTIVINGIISKDTTISIGGSREITYSPNEGYTLDSIIVNGVYSNQITMDSINRFTFKNIYGDSTIKLVYKLQTFTIISSAGEGGSISPQDTTIIYYGTKVQYTITPNRGYVVDTLFINGNRVDSTTSYTFDTVKADQTISVKFKVQTFSITSTAGIGGGISPQGINIFNYGSKPSYTILPNTGYILDSLFVNGLKVDSISSYTFDSVKSDQTISVKFKVQTFTITSSAGIGGGISPQGINTFNYGSKPSYTILPNTGYILDSLFVNGLKVDSITSYTFDIVKSDQTISVKFKVLTFSITSSAEIVGSISPQGINTFNYGSKPSYTILPNTGYVLDSLFVNGLKVDSTTSYTFDSVKSDQTISAKFKVQTFTITSSAGEGGSISPQGTTLVNYGGNHAYSITPNIGFVIDTIFVNGVKVDSISSYTFDSVKADQTISVKFKVQIFTITSSAGIGGGITPQGINTFNYGSKPSYTILPNTGYVLDSLFVNGLKVDSTTSYTFDSVKSDQTISVKFKVQTFTITSSAGNGGSISPQDTTIINYGTKLQYTITPNIGYIVDTLFVNGNRVDSTTSYTFDSVKSNQTIVVKFKPITAPGKPLNVFAVEGDSKAIIHFVSPIYNGGVPINKYIVEEIGGNYKDSGATSPITITGLTNLQTYQFSVKAVNSYGLVSDTSLSNLIQPVEMKLVKTIVINGIISKDTTISIGGSREITYSPNEGYTLDSIIVNGVYSNQITMDSINRFTFKNIYGDSTIKLVYKLQTFTIISSAGEGGSISPQDTTIINYGTKVQYTITPNTGFVLDSLFVNGVKVDSITSYTFDSLKSDQTILVKFKVQKFSITSSAGNGGSISPQGINNVNYGANASYTFTPNTGYVIDSVIVNGVKINNVNNYTFNNVTGDSSIRVTFKLQTFTIISSAGNGGSISPQDTNNVNYGAKASYTFTPNTGYFIDSVFINGVLNIDSLTGYTFNYITQSQTMRVVFTPITAPSKPRNVIGISGNKKIILRFLSPTNFGSKSIVKYIAKVLDTNIKDSSTTTAITLTGLTIGQTYNITVQAVNNEGLISDTTLVSNILHINSTEIISTHRPTYKIGDTIQLRGNGIKTLKLKSFASRDSFEITNFITKTPISSDTNYTFIVPNTVKNELYIINAFSYTKQLSDSIRLVRFFVIPSNIDSFGVVAWGDNSDRQTSIPTSLNNVVQIAGGVYHSLALKADGTVVAWGNNQYGQTTIPDGLNNVVQIAAGYVHSFALKADGTVVAWGSNLSGQTNIPAGINNVVQIAVGGSHNIVLKVDGTVDAWGINWAGQTSIPAGLNNVVQIAGGFSHSMALKIDGTVVAWGDNFFKQTTIPVGINNVTQIALSYRANIAIKADSTLVAWGYNGYGETNIPDGLNNVVQVAGGEYHFLALKANGTVVEWGVNGYGQPIIPAELNNVIQIAGGYNHNLAIIKLYVNTTSNSGGTISPTTFVKNGDSLRITFQPNIGYFIDSIFINGVLNIDSLTGYTFKNITQFQNVRVVYKLQTFTITSSAGNGGSISPQGINTLNYGSKSIYTITPNRGFLIDSLLINGLKVDSISSYTFDSVKADQTISVKFKVQTFTITSSAGIGGGISPQGINTFNYGSKPSYTILPNTGYVLDSLFVNGLKVDSITSYTFDSIKSDQTISVKFKVQTFSITSSAGNGGSISPQDTTIINYGTKVLYTITSNIGYIVDTLFVNGNRVDSTTSYTFDSVKSNQTIVVKFKPITAPGKPLNVFAVEGDSKAIIHFVSPIYNGGVPINKYIVEEIGGNYKDSGATSPITITGLTNLQTYQFSVKAVNSYGLVSDTSLSNLIQPVEMKLVKTIVINGIISKDTTISIGGSREITYSPNEGYTLDSIIVNGVYSNQITMDSINRFTFKNIYGDSTIKLVYKLQTFTIISSAGEGGSISPQDTTIIYYGTKVQYTITPNRGYVVDTLFVNGNRVDSTTSYTFDSVKADQTISVKFKVQTFSITSTAGIGGGISPQGINTFNYGSKPSYTILPNTGYILDSLFVNGLKVDSISSYTFDSVKSDQTISVKFKVQTFTITSSAGIGGGISPQGINTFNYGSKPSYTILPNTGYILDSLFVNGLKVDSITSYTFDSVKSDQTISVKFKVLTFSITSSAEIVGSISPQGINTFNYGSKPSYTILPNTGYVLDSLFVNGLKVDSTTSYTFDSVKSDQTISAKFKVQTFTITSSAGEGGSISPQGTTLVNYGGNHAYSITPNIGFVIDTIFVNGVKVDSISSYTFDSVKADQTISVKFKVQIFTITSSAGIGGGITPQGINTFNYGSKPSYTILPNTGYVLDSLFVNGLKVDSTTSYTFDSVKSDQTISVKFKVQTFTITSSAGNGGSISPQDTTIINYGTKLQYTITPNIGYIVDTLFVNGNRVDSTTSYTFDSVKSNQTISVKFKIQSFSITSFAEMGGSISPQGISTLNYGSKPIYTITPNRGFVIDTVFVNGLKIDSISNYTFDSVKANQTISVKFKVQTFTITSSAGNGGSITPQDTTIINYGTKVQYTITSNIGYIVDTLFVNGNRVDSTTSYTFDSVKFNQTISVKFKVQTFTITSSAEIGGGISPQGISILNYGTKPIYTISPNTGYVLDSLFVNGLKVDSITSYTFDSIKSDQTISVKFKILTFSITSSAEIDGSISPQGISSVNYVTKLQYTITPNIGYIVDTLFVNGNRVDSTTSYTFDSVKSDQTISVKFKVQTFTITSSAGNGGSISPQGISTLNYGAKPIYTITPNRGFVLDSLLINGLKVDSISSYTFDSVKSNQTISVKFKVQTFTITSSAGNGGSISPQGINTLNYGSKSIYTITPNTGYILDSLFVNGLKVDSISSYTFDSVKANQTISVKFKLQTFSITSTAGSGGSISPQGISILIYGTKPIYTISPNTGYVLDSLFVNGLKVDSITSYTFDSIKSDQTISVKFKILTFSITSSAEIEGSISPQGISSVNYVTKLQYTITPNIGYVVDTLFVNGNRVDSTTSYTFDSVKSDQTISVKFKVQTFTITSSAGNGGSISPQGINTLNYGAKPIYTITPNRGFVLDSLLINGLKVDSISSYTFDSVKANQTILVKFKVQTFTLTSSAENGGSISPQGTNTLNYGTKPIYTITPNRGFVIDSLFVNDVKVDSITSYTFDSVKANQTISVKFKVQTFSITSSAENGGSISPQGTNTLNYGSKPTYTITPNRGFVIDSLFVNGLKVDSITSYTFDSVKSNQTISVKFKVQTFTLTSSAGNGGSISPQGISTLNYGSKPIYTITPNRGFVIDTVFVNGLKVDSISNYTFDSVKANQTISVKFKLQTFTITSSAGNGGSISPQGINTLNYGSKSIYTITPNTGYILDSLFVNGLKVDSISSYTFDSVKANQTISVKFKLQTFSITSTAGNGGSISPQGISILIYGTKPIYTISPNTGYVLDSLFVNGLKVDSITSYTFDSIKSDQTISVKFKVQTFSITSSAENGGSISPQGTNTLNYGAKPIYTITPNRGFVIDSLFVNGLKVDSITSYTFDSVKSNQTISVKFKVQTFTLTSSAGNGGSISPQGTSTFNYGTKPIYTILPNTGFILDSLFVNDVNVDSISSYTFDSLKANQTISVKFKEQTFSITSSAGNGGSISPQGISTFNYGSKPTYTITPNTGFVIDSLFVNGLKVDSITSYTFDSVKSDQTISVKFKVQTFTITATAGNGGSISPQGTSTLNYGSKPTYTITPNRGFVLDSLFVNDVNVDSISSYTFDSVKSDQTISVKFKVQTFTITATAGNGGSISPQGTSTLNYGSKPTYTITPNRGFVLDSLFVNDVNVDSISSYTFDSVKSDQTISVKFKVQTFTITATAGNGGSISPQGISSLNYGAKPIYTITPNRGFVIDSLFVNGLKVDSISSYTFDSVKSNQTISVKFKVQTFTLTSSAGNGGSISPQGISTLNYGSKPTYTITPNRGFVLDSLFVNDVNVDSISSYTFDSVKANQTISVKFKVQTFSITSSAGDGGSISPQGISTINYGAKPSYTISPNIGYVLDSLLINGLKVDSISSYTFDSVKSNQTISVKFKVQTFSITSSAGNGGSISPQDTTIINYGTKVQYTITSNIGYIVDTLFVNGNRVDSTTSYTFDSVKANQTISVKFKVQTFTITSSAEIGGSISPQGISTINYGAKPTYIITPNTGYILDSLFVNVLKVDSISSYTFDSVKDNQTILVKFKQITPPSKPLHVLAISGNEQAIIRFESPLNNGGVSISKYIVEVVGENIKDSSIRSPIIITGLTNFQTYQFSVKAINNYGLESDTSLSNSIQPDNNLRIIKSSVINGKITADTTVSLGEFRIISYSPKEGFTLDSIFINGIYSNEITRDSINRYTFKNINGDSIIKVVYKLKQFNIIASAGMDGSISPQGISSVYYGTKPIYTITPNTGFILDSLFVNGLKVDSITSYTFDSVKANQTISVKFKVQTFSITSSAVNGGGITPQGTNTLNYGTKPTYIITPNTGFVLDSLFVNGLKVDSISSYTFDSVKSNQTILVKFKQITPPSKPLHVLAISGNEQAIIRFESPLNNGGVSISKYIVEVVGENIKDSSIRSPIIITGLTNFQTYQFSVKAINNFGLESDTSLSNSIQPDSNLRFIKSSAINGKITADTTVSLGEFRIISYSPKEGFTLDSIFINGIYSNEITRDSINRYTFKNINGDSIIKVVYKLKQFNIIASAGMDGSISPQGISSVYYGSKLIYTITPNRGFVLDSLFVNDVKVDSISSYTFDSVKSNQTISVKFKVQTFTITSSAGNGGSITPQGISTLNYGSKPIYTITPNTGFVIDTVFVNGLKVDSISNYTFDSVKANQTISVKFKIQSFSITSSAEMGGSISPQGISTLNYGSKPIYTITPNRGFVIDKVFVNGLKVDSITSYTFDSVKSNQTISVIFKVQTFTITSSAGDGGSISPQGISTINYGAKPSYTISPNIGYVLDSLLINGLKVDSISSYTFDSVKSNQTISVKFKVQTFSITSSAGNGGSISPQDTTIINYGTKVQYTITSNIGYIVDTLFVNGNRVDSTTSYTFDSVKANQTISVKFKVQTFSITTSAVNGGGITPQGTNTLNYGTKPTYIITPNTGFVLDSLFVNGLKVDSISSYTFDSVKSNQTILVKFKQITPPSKPLHVLAISGNEQAIIRFESPLNNGGVSISKYIVEVVGENIKDSSIRSPIIITGLTNFQTYQFSVKAINNFGLESDTSLSNSIQPDSNLRFIKSSVINGKITADTTVSLGEFRIISYSPKEGFTLDSIFINGIYSNEITRDSINRYTFKNINGDSIIKVVYKLKQFNIIASAGMDGSISPQGISSVYYGTKPIYTITPNTGFILDSLFVNGLKVDSITSYTFDSVKANQTISVKFKVQTFSITSSAVNGGGITPQGINTLNYGAKPIYTITPNTGYILDSLFVNGLNVDSISSYTFDSVKSNQTILVKFKQITPPSKPLHVLAISGNEQAIIRFESPLNNGGVSISKYIVEVVGENIKDSSIRSPIIITGLTNFQTYQFSVKAINNFGLESDTSLSNSIQPDSNLRFIKSSVINGKITADTTVSLGEFRIISYSPKEGFTLDSIFINGIYSNEITRDSINRYTFKNINGDSIIKVVYKLKQFNIIASAGMDGSINPQGISSVYYGTKPSYTITPNRGFVIDTVFVNGLKVDSITSYTFDSVKSNQTISVKFKVQTFTITSSAGNGGSITPQGINTLNYGTKPIYTITPSTGFILDTLFVNGVKVDSNSSYTFDSVKSNQTISVKFKVQTFTITSSAGNGGSITPQGINTLNYGTKPIYTITPNTGFILDSLFVNGLKVDSITSYTFDSVKSNQTISVIFKVQTFTITSSAGDGGSISPQGISTINYGAKPSYTISPNIGYVLDSLLINGLKVDSISSYTFDSVKSNQTISVKFKVQTFSITSSAGNGGSISPQDTTIINYGTKVQYTITSNIGYIVDTLFVNGNRVDSTTSYTFDSVKANQTISVKFKVQTFTITSSAEIGGSISPQGISTINYGAKPTYIITPNTGYILDSLFVNVLKVDSISSYTFDSVKDNQTILVKFKQITPPSKPLHVLAISGNEQAIIRFESPLNNGGVSISKYIVEVVGENIKDSSIRSPIIITGLTNFQTYQFSVKAINNYGLESDTSLSNSIQPDNNLRFIKSSVINGKITADTTVSLGEFRIISYSPKEGFILDSIFINGIYSNEITRDSINRYTFKNINGDSIIKVVYKLKQFNIIASAGMDGSINPQGISSVYYGTKPIYTITPNTGFILDSLFVNGLKVDSITSYTFDTVKSNQTISAKFKVQTFTITSSAGEGGSISSQGTSTLNYGTKPSYTITPNTGYILDSLFVNGLKVDSISSYTFDSVKSNQTISAIFKVQTFTITSSAGNGGSITPQGINTLNYGTKPIYTITPNTGFILDSLFVNGLKVDSITSYTFDSVKSNQTISVIFKVQTFTITSSAGDGGSISPQGISTINYGAKPSYTISPNIGYVLDSLLINGLKVDSISSYTFDSVKSDQTISVKFKLQTFTIISIAGTGGSISPQGTNRVNYGANAIYTFTPNTEYVIDSVIVNGVKVDSTTSYTFNNISANQTIQVIFKLALVCPQTKLSPNIVRVGSELKSDITTFAKQRWYLAGTIKDSTTNNTYTPTDAGVYTLLGIDSIGCESNLSKKYYYSRSCIISTGRLGNGANIQANIVGNANLIIIKWCTDLIKENITIQLLDISGAKVYEQEVPYNLGSMILNKSNITSKNYYIQVLDSKGEIMQISDLIKN